MANCITNGNLYENGKANEIKVNTGANIKIQAKKSCLYLQTLM